MHRAVVLRFFIEKFYLKGIIMLFLFLFQIVLIALNAIFASAEIAVLSINETKLERMASEGDGKARRLFKLTREPAKFLATIQVAITLSGFLGSAFAADNFSAPLVSWVQSLGVTLSAEVLDTIAVIVITLILSYFTLVFGELVPKRVAMKKSEQIAMGISGMVSGIAIIFKPVVWFLSASTNVVLRLFGIDPNEVEDDVSEEEIRMMVDAGSEKGTIDHHEKELIQNIFEFNDICAGDITTHRTDVVMLHLKDDDAAWAQAIHDSKHTLYPICDESVDDIVGILNAKEYFRLEDRSRERVLEEAVHPAYFVPENIKADVLFKNMNSTRNSLAVVMDEYGGMVGIVTMYDLIEELVGELNTSDTPEEESEQKPHSEQIDSHRWQIVGNMRLEELDEQLGVSLASEDYDTLTGLVFGVLGAIPEDGEQMLEIEFENIIVSVLCVQGHQIERAIITIKPQEKLDGETS